MLSRRGLLGALTLPVLAGCAEILPPLEGETSPEGQAVLRESAAAHGADALERIADVSVSYAGRFGPLVGRLQPALIDGGFRGTSEERLLLRAGITAQAHRGPEGRKQVVRRAGRGGTDQGSIQVWINAIETQDADRRAASALVADGYSLFLMGPMWLARSAAIKQIQLAQPETIELDGQQRACDVLRARIVPGLGFSEWDELALYLDRDGKLMRRVRFSLEGLDGTKGAVAEVDTFDHVERAGVHWPTRFHERLLRPLPLSVHDWRLTGLDFDRGLEVDDVTGPEFGAYAVRPAAPIG